MGEFPCEAGITLPDPTNVAPWAALRIVGKAKGKTRGIEGRWWSMDKIIQRIMFYDEQKKLWFVDTIEIEQQDEGEKDGQIAPDNPKEWN